MLPNMYNCQTCITALQYINALVVDNNASDYNFSNKCQPDQKRKGFT